MTMAAQGLFAGFVATVLIDAWALVLKSVLGLPTTNWAMVGRWVGHLRHGRFTHQKIDNAAPVAGERLLGWATHYAIGLLYGVGYLWLIAIEGGKPSLLSAVIFSLLLLVAPWFILQPGLGLGILARRAPKPWLIRAISVTVHVVFGIGLYAGCWFFGQPLF